MQVSDVTNFLGITDTKSKEAIPAESPAQAPEPQGPREVLYEWEAQARTSLKKVNKKFLRTLIVIGVVLAILLIIMQEFFLILVIASLIFITYTLAVTPSQKISYQITNQGIKYDDKFYMWSEFKHFFLTRKDATVVNVDLKNALPARLYLTIKDEDYEKVKGIMARYLPFVEKGKEDFIDKAYSSVVNKLNLE